MAIPTEPIGSIPRPQYLLDALTAGTTTEAELAAVQARALTDTVERFAATGSPVITDGEQTKPSFATYPLSGIAGLAPDGVVVPFDDGHTRQFPRLTEGPFRYGVHAGSYLTTTLGLTDLPVKQAVIAPSLLSLIYPADGIDGYSRDQFLADLADEAEADIRQCLDGGATTVQLDFTEGRLSLKLDPSKGVLRDFVTLNNAVLDRFSGDERAKLGVHTCPGGDQDAVHSADVDYAELLPELFRLNAGRFYVQLASETDRPRVLRLIAEHSRDDQFVFVGVTDPIDPRVETPEEVRDRVLEAAEYISPDRLGTCDDCGFSPFADDVSTSRDTAFAKIAARVAGTELAAARLGI